MVVDCELPSARKGVEDGSGFLSVDWVIDFLPGGSCSAFLTTVFCIGFSSLMGIGIDAGVPDRL